MPGGLSSVIGTGGVWRSATCSCLAVGPWVADVVIVAGRYDSSDPIVWARLVTWSTNGLPWLPSTASLVVSALFAARSVVARILMAVDIVNVGAVERSVCKTAAGVFWDADGIAGTVVGGAIFASSASWLAVIVALSSGSGLAILPEDLAVVIGCFDGVCDEGPSTFFLLLSLHLRSFYLLCNARVLSCFLWVAGSVQLIFCWSPNFSSSVILRILSGVLFARLVGGLFDLVCCQTMPRPRFASSIAMVASHLHLLFSHSMTSLQSVLPALSRNVIIVPVRSLNLAACFSWLAKLGASQMFSKVAPCSFASVQVVVLLMLQHRQAPRPL